MSNLTFSRLKRAAICPGSIILPQVDDVSPWAERGTIIHRHIEAVFQADVGAMEAVREAAREFDKLGDPPEGESDAGPAGSLIALIDGMDPDEIEAMADGLPNVQVELAMWYHPATDEGGILGTRLNRDYSKAPSGAICGTIDLAAWSDTRIRIIDWKSGWSEQDPADSNRQLRAAAVALSRFLNVENVHVQIVSLDEKGATFPHRPAVMDAFEIDAAAGELAMVVDRIDLERDGVRPSLTVGEHCRHCSAFTNCPAQAGAVTALIELGADPQALTPEIIREAWPRYQAVKAVLPKIGKVFKEYVTRTPVELDDGKVLAIYNRKDGQSYDTLKLYELARKMFGADAARDMVGEVSFSRAGVERALGVGDAAKLFAQAAVDDLITYKKNSRLEAKRIAKGGKK